MITMSFVKFILLLPKVDLYSFAFYAALQIILFRHHYAKSLFTTTPPSLKIPFEFKTNEYIQVNIYLNTYIYSYKKIDKPVLQYEHVYTFI